eukprot:10895520-Alexandrium_andersonii.AAC.1
MLFKLRAGRAAPTVHRHKRDKCCYKGLQHAASVCNVCCALFGAHQAPAEPEARLVRHPAM